MAWTKTVLVLPCLMLISGGMQIPKAGISHSDDKNEHEYESEDENLTGDLKPRIQANILAVPSIKLVFCYIDKNACSQFNRLCNSLNGVQGEENSTVPVWWASSIMESNMTIMTAVRRQGLANIFEDPTWTKAVFLREPLDRLTSAFRSKCEPPLEQYGQFCLDRNFSKLVKKLPSRGRSNRHFLPQSDFCTVNKASLGDMIHAYDYIGHITNEHSKVHKQVMDMLLMAANRSTNKRVIASVLERAVNESFVPVSAADSNEDFLSTPTVPNDEEIIDNISSFFPSNHAGGDPSHVTSVLGKSAKDYFNSTTVANAMAFYSRDYELPGLTRPRWASNM